MAAPVLVLVMPSAPDPSSQLSAQRIRQRMARLHPHVETAVAFADPRSGRHRAPDPATAWQEAVLVPVDVTHLQDPDRAVVDLASRFQQDHPDIEVRLARPVGPAPALLSIVDSRLRLAAHRAHCLEMDSLVLSTPDAGDQRGASVLSRMARAWAQHHHLPVHLATNNHESTSVGEVIAQQRRSGRRHVAVGSLWVCDDTASRRHARLCLEAGAEVVAAPLGDDPLLAARAFERYCSAAMGVETVDLGPARRD